MRQKAGDVRQATGDTVGSIKQKVDEVRGASPAVADVDSEVDEVDEVIVIPTSARDQTYTP